MVDVIFFLLLSFFFFYFFLFYQIVIAITLSVKPSMQAFAVMLLPTALIPCWYSMFSHVERQVNLYSHDFHSNMQSEVENTAKFLHPINSSATSLAGVLRLPLNETKLSFSKIETKVGIHILLSQRSCK